MQLDELNPPKPISVGLFMVSFSWAVFLLFSGWAVFVVGAATLMYVSSGILVRFVGFVLALPIAGVIGVVFAGIITWAYVQFVIRRFSRLEFIHIPKIFRSIIVLSLLIYGAFAIRGAVDFYWLSPIAVLICLVFVWSGRAYLRYS